ncbi:MAG: dTDP-4-dehydrorhamnose 3,5-epimerase family protein [Desulfurispora sp.]|uniref:dTDP-4-dehydrorhamnose 3,5-epimerase family protein n=1 Tax=Desulfurispora sp. TaxID=3014275 RepID=UPI004048F0FB
MQEWKSGPIEGVYIKNLVKNVDERGFLVETYRLDELPPDLTPVMSYVSYTEPGVSRGPHAHAHQTDVFAFIGPANFLVKLWDNRSSSPTYGNCLQFYAGQDNPVLVVVPPGVVHGYKNISRLQAGMVLNYPNRLYRGEGRRQKVDEIRYEDMVDAPFYMGEK